MPAPETVLALVAEEAKKGTPLAKISELLLYEAKSSALVPWVTKQFAELEAAHPDACRLLVELVGEELDELRLEVEKLVPGPKGKEQRARRSPWSTSRRWCCRA